MLLSITGRHACGQCLGLDLALLGLELTSLPTYVMVVMGRAGRRGSEVGQILLLGRWRQPCSCTGLLWVRRNRSMQLADIAEIVASRRNL